MSMPLLDLGHRPYFETAQLPERQEIPCKDLDLDCFAFDGVIPFGDYRRCHAYDPDAGRCIFLTQNSRAENR